MKKHVSSNRGILIRAESCPHLKGSRGQRPTKGMADSHSQLMSILEPVLIERKVDRGGPKPC